MKMRFALLVLFTCVFAISTNLVIAQSGSATPIQCGAIVQGETDIQNGDYYALNLLPGDVLNVNLVGISKTESIYVNVSTQSGGELAWAYPEGGHAEFDNLVLTATGTYIINARADGAYTLYVGCVSRTGTEIAPGESPSNTTTSTVATIAPPAFSGTGFPGLPPVDFSSVALIPIQSAQPITGGIAPTGNVIIGYTLSVNSGDTVDLSFQRMSGNLNLGLVVLSSDNEVVFQTSLVTSTSLDTKFVIPTSGMYTIGIFRIGLLKLANPAPTSFQITATVNFQG